MKLITLNTWGGHISEPLLRFFEDNKDIDIFCLQEINHEAWEKEENASRSQNFDLYKDIEKILTQHKGYFRPSVGDHYGLAMFVKKELNVKREGGISIYEVPDYKGGGNHSRNLQYVEIELGSKRVTVMNVHGIWTGKGKTDTPERLEQSKRIRDFMDTVDGSKILCGDFNLLPDTESVKILEKGMRNLIKDYGVEGTRTSFYLREDKFADYIFVSPEVEVKDFKVLPDEVSDHSALLLELA